MSATATTLKYWAIAKVSYAHGKTYIFDRLSVILMVSLRLWILSQLYTIAYDQYSQSSIGGLTVASTVWSLAITNCFLLSSGTRHMLLSVADDIKTGNIAYILVRPYSFLSYLYFSNVGRIISRLIPSVIISFVLCWFLVGPISVSSQSLLAGLL